MSISRNRPPSARRQRGSALIEYSILTMLGVIVLIAQPNIVMEVVEALRTAYSSFVFAISLAWL